MLSAIREILSENGVLSSKRVAGLTCVFVACGVDIALAVKFGANSVVENITLTLIIGGLALLGVTKVADSWASVKSNKLEE